MGHETWVKKISVRIPVRLLLSMTKEEYFNTGMNALTANIQISAVVSIVYWRKDHPVLSDITLCPVVKFKAFF